jgi:hypothetical protein
MDEFGLYPGNTIPNEKWRDATTPINDYTVSLFRGDKPQGSGVLISADNVYGILTAHHVSKNALKGNATDELTIVVANHLHRFNVSLAACLEVVIGKYEECHESHGPDLAFIQITDLNKLGTLKSKKSFYKLDRNKIEIIKQRPYQKLFWWICGAPAEKLRIHKQPNEFVGRSVIFCGETTFMNESFVAPHDYVHLKIDAGVANFPTNYGGMSGSGAWLVFPTINPDIGLSSISFESPILAGIVFYQTAPQNSSRLIHLHGPKSIYEIALKSILPKV